MTALLVRPFAAVIDYNKGITDDEKVPAVENTTKATRYRSQRSSGNKEASRNPGVTCGSLLESEHQARALTNTTTNKTYQRRG